MPNSPQTTLRPSVRTVGARYRPNRPTSAGTAANRMSIGYLMKHILIQLLLTGLVTLTAICCFAASEVISGSETPASADQPVQTAAQPVTSKDGATALLSFAEVKKTVLKHFAGMRGYEPGDLLTQGEVAPVFQLLAHQGWTVTDAKEILESVPTESDFIVQQLRTPEGLKFMREISGTPHAYDRLERMTHLPRGKQTVATLIGRGPKGADVITYFADTKDGAKMGRQLSKSRGAADFNKPTGRIYTADMLLKRLQKSYKQAAKALEVGSGS